MDAWLRDGGAVVAASERGARAIAEAYHRARRAEGLTAWAAPNVRDWQSFALKEWAKRNADARMVLNPLQEQALWAGIVKEHQGGAGALKSAQHRLAAMAMDAHRLICGYAPRYLDARARRAWQQDAGIFSEWLSEFDEECQGRECVSSARLVLELAEALKGDANGRNELLLAGFDRILPVHAALLEAWGQWHEREAGTAAKEVSFFEAADMREELTACALWCKRELASKPEARLLVVTQDEAGRRGEIERVLLRHFQPEGGSAAAALFEFSLGLPLAQTALGRGALLTLKWLSRAIAENEIDWLLSTGQIAATEDESRALTAYMRALRRKNLQRTEWNLTDWMSQRGVGPVADAWMRRMMQAKRDLEATMRQTKSPLDWVEFAKQLLEGAGWPGGRPLGSEEHQVMQRFDRVMDDCASLGFDGERMAWTDFVDALERAAAQALFAPESKAAPILIAGPAETAGIEVDGIWFLGASEDLWPVAGTTHPFLPMAVQRQARMPHAAAQFDWEVAQAMTARLLASAPEVNFSYARQSDGVEARPSRLITKIAGKPQSLPPELRATRATKAATQDWADASTVPFPGGKVRGGAGVLTAQSQCPFKAFATARLGAESWNAGEAGLTALQRGNLMHAVLKLVWDANNGGVDSHKELMAVADLRGFVETRVEQAMDEELRNGERDVMPPRYLELEHVRLTNLVTEWLEFERTRVEFTVVGTEVGRNPQIGGLDLRLRIDRLDRLQDGKLLVIDYKTGIVDKKAWELPRPDDLQLPLYAGFALDEGAQCGGLVFAKIRAGGIGMDGRVEDAKSTLLAGLSAQSGLAKKKLTEQDLLDWRVYIEKLARDFVAGEAKVDPRDPPTTCERCGMQTLCRIAEFEALDGDDDDTDEEGGDE